MGCGRAVKTHVLHRMGDRKILEIMAIGIKRERQAYENLREEGFNQTGKCCTPTTFRMW